MFLLFQIGTYGQDHTHVYSKIVGGNAWAGTTDELTNFTSCQTTASIDINGFNWAGWAVGYTLQVNGTDVATGLSGSYTYDLTDYLPVNDVKLIATSGSGWIELSATLSITSPGASMPNSTPIVSDVNYPTYGMTATPLTATLTGNGQTLKWYTLQTGDVASFTAPTPSTTVSGTTTYWVSQADASGCEGVRIPVRVTVPAPLNIAHVSDEQCGGMLANANSYVYANLVKNAQAYRFRVTDMATGETQEKDCVLRNLMLSSMPFFRYAAQYRIEVALKRANTWSEFGLPCYVNTPTAFTSVRQSQCGSVIEHKSDYVYADIVPFAKGYQFSVMNWNTGSWQVIESATRSFSFNSVSDYIPGTTYSIQVAVKNTDGIYLPFGPECTVTTAGTAVNTDNGELFKMADAETVEAAFAVTAYPNPFSQEFSLSVDTASQSVISVKIYDMLGRLVEDKKYEAKAKRDEMTLGSGITGSGIYNVIVSQGDQVETLRMVKR